MSYTISQGDYDFCNVMKAYGTYFPVYVISLIIVQFFNMKNTKMRCITVKISS